jgi:solute carrier family 45 protein 1/2/4
MIPPLPDSDPDPTTQIPWPAARVKLQADSTTHATVLEDDPGQHGEVRAKPVPGKRHLSTWNLITLSISMAGAQIAWTVELG